MSIINKDRICPEKEFFKKDLKNKLEDYLSIISERDAEIIKLRFWEKKTLQECADMYNISRTRIQQIEARVVRIFRRNGIIKELKEYMYDN